MHKQYIDPDDLWNDPDADNIPIVFIYDILTGILYSRQSQDTHAEIVRDNYKDFKDVFESQDPEDNNNWSPADFQLAKNNIYQFKSILQDISVDRLAFGRCKLLPPDSKDPDQGNQFFISFWEKYDNYMVEKAVKEIFKAYPQYSYDANVWDKTTNSWRAYSTYICLPQSGCTLMGQKPTNNPNKGISDDDLKKAKELHMLQGLEKKNALMNLGATGKPNKWASEIRRLGLGQEPWRMHSEGEVK
jgi:hypothetical protein